MSAPLMLGMVISGFALGFCAATYAVDGGRGWLAGALVAAAYFTVFSVVSYPGRR